MTSPLRQALERNWLPPLSPAVGTPKGGYSNENAGAATPSSILKRRRSALVDVTHLGDRKSPGRKKSRASLGRRVSFAPALHSVHEFQRDASKEASKEPEAAAQKPAQAPVSPRAARPDAAALEVQEAAAPAPEPSPVQQAPGPRSPEEAFQPVSSPAEPPAGELPMDMSLTFNVPIEGGCSGTAATPSSVMDCGTTHLGGFETGAIPSMGADPSPSAEFRLMSGLQARGEPRDGEGITLEGFMGSLGGPSPNAPPAPPLGGDDDDSTQTGLGGADRGATRRGRRGSRRMSITAGIPNLSQLLADDAEGWSPASGASPLGPGAARGRGAGGADSTGAITAAVPRLGDLCDEDEADAASAAQAAAEAAAAAASAAEAAQLGGGVTAAIPSFGSLVDDDEQDWSLPAAAPEAASGNGSVGASAASALDGITAAIPPLSSLAADDEADWASSAAPEPAAAAAPAAAVPAGVLSALAAEDEAEDEGAASPRLRSRPSEAPSVATNATNYTVPLLSSFADLAAEDEADEEAAAGLSPLGGGEVASGKRSLGAITMEVGSLAALADADAEAEAAAEAAAVAAAEPAHSSDSASERTLEGGSASSPSAKTARSSHGGASLDLTSSTEAAALDGALDASMADNEQQQEGAGAGAADAAAAPGGTPVFTFGVVAGDSPGISPDLGVGLQMTRPLSTPRSVTKGSIFDGYSTDGSAGGWLGSSGHAPSQPQQAGEMAVDAAGAENTTGALPLLSPPEAPPAVEASPQAPASAAGAAVPAAEPTATVAVSTDDDWSCDGDKTNEFNAQLARQFAEMVARGLPATPTSELGDGDGDAGEDHTATTGVVSFYPGPGYANALPLPIEPTPAPAAPPPFEQRAPLGATPTLRGLPMLPPAPGAGIQAAFAAVAPPPQLHAAPLSRESTGTFSFAFPAGLAHAAASNLLPRRSLGAALPRALPAAAPAARPAAADTTGPLLLNNALEVSFLSADPTATLPHALLVAGGVSAPRIHYDEFKTKGGVTFLTDKNLLRKSIAPLPGLRGAMVAGAAQEPTLHEALLLASATQPETEAAEALRSQLQELVQRQQAAAEVTAEELAREQPLLFAAVAAPKDDESLQAVRDGLKRLKIACKARGKEAVAEMRAASDEALARTLAGNLESLQRAQQDLAEASAVLAKTRAGVQGLITAAACQLDDAEGRKAAMERARAELASLRERRLRSEEAGRALDAQLAAEEEAAAALQARRSGIAGARAEAESRIATARAAAALAAAPQLALSAVPASVQAAARDAVTRGHEADMLHSLQTWRLEGSSGSTVFLRTAYFGAFRIRVTALDNGSATAAAELVPRDTLGRGEAELLLAVAGPLRSQAAPGQPAATVLHELSTRLRRAEALLGELRAALLANPHLTGARLAADGASGFALEACDYAGLRLLRVGIAASVAQYPLGEQWNATVQVVLPGAGNPFTEGQAAALADAISSIPAGRCRLLKACAMLEAAVVAAPRQAEVQQQE